MHFFLFAKLKIIIKTVFFLYEHWTTKEEWKTICLAWNSSNDKFQSLWRWMVHWMNECKERDREKKNVLIDCNFPYFKAIHRFVSAQIQKKMKETCVVSLSKPCHARV